MPVVRKFEFEESFDPPSRHARVKAREAEPPAPPPPPPPPPAPPPPPPEPTFSAAELAAARNAGWAEGHAQGHAAGLAEANAQIERRLAMAGEQLNAQLALSGEAQNYVREGLERDATEIALTVIRKLFPALVERTGTSEFEALLCDVFEHTLEEPRIIVRCPADIRDSFEPWVQRAALAAGFEGRLSIIGDPRLGPSDCRIEWTDGGVERDPARLMASVEAIVAQGIEAFDRRRKLAGTGAIGATEEIEQ